FLAYRCRPLVRRLARSRRSGLDAMTLRWQRCRCCAWRIVQAERQHKTVRRVLPRRWVVERTFSWFGRNRRLAKDFENLAETLASFVTIAFIQLALRRLARA